MIRQNRAVFLDRDGIINKERKDYVKILDELEIFPDIYKIIKKLKSEGFLVVVVTNQSAINRGFTNHQNVKEIHHAIQEYLRKNGTSIDGFYYCPHRPDEKCYCRKPQPGLILKASRELKIELSSSWMIGDSDSDILAANIAGCKSIKCDNITLSKAVKTILDSRE